MKYMVVECGLSYAVVLDSDGRFLKVPNLGYEVGQVLDQVVLTQTSGHRSAPVRRMLRQVTAAACLCVALLGSWLIWRTPMGTVRVQINPEMQMTVNRYDRVIALEGLNSDGQLLLDGFRSYGRSVKRVSADLADRALELDYLEDGGQITLTVHSDRIGWKTNMEAFLTSELSSHLDGHDVTVTLSSGQTETPPADHPQETPLPPVSDEEDDDDDDDDGDDDDDDDEDDDDEPEYGDPWDADE
jgi:hypothetical protein